jgi:hypothetical protein
VDYARDQLTKEFIKIQQDINHNNANLPLYMTQWYMHVFYVNTTLGNVNVMFSQEDK